MSASDHLQGEQLAMFIPGKELKGYRPAPGDVAAHGRVERNREEWAQDLGSTYEPRTFWEMKKEEADTWGYTESIAKEGVHTPVHVYHQAEGGPQIAQGHHRIAAAGPEQLVPVHHYGAPHHTALVAMMDRPGHHRENVPLSRRDDPFYPLAPNWATPNRKM